MAATAPLKISDFRDSLRESFGQVTRHHRPVAIEHGASGERAVLLGVDEVLRLLGPHQFHPEVFPEDEAVSIWLPEFGVYGRGANFAEARDDLIHEVRDYVEEYLEHSDEYVRAPNRAHHFPFVVKAFLSDLSGGLEATVFAEPTDSLAAV